MGQLIICAYGLKTYRQRPHGASRAEMYAEATLGVRRSARSIRAEVAEQMCTCSKIKRQAAMNCVFGPGSSRTTREMLHCVKGNNKNMFFHYGFPDIVQTVQTVRTTKSSLTVAPKQGVQNSSVRSTSVILIFFLCNTKWKSQFVRMVA